MAEKRGREVVYTRQVNVRLTEAQWGRLREVAERVGLSDSVAARAAVVHGLPVVLRAWGVDEGGAS